MPTLSQKAQKLENVQQKRSQFLSENISVLVGWQLTECVQNVSYQHEFAGVKLNHRDVSQQLGTLQGKLESRHLSGEGR